MHVFCIVQRRMAEDCNLRIFESFSVCVSYALNYVSNAPDMQYIHIQSFEKFYMCYFGLMWVHYHIFMLQLQKKNIPAAGCKKLRPELQNHLQNETNTDSNVKIIRLDFIIKLST